MIFIQETNMDLRTRLKADLFAKRYNLGHLATEAQVSRSYLSRVLTGYVSPSIHLAQSLATAANKLTQTKNYTSEQFLTAAQELNK